MKDLREKQFELLRIPKTGSESLKQAFMYAPLVLVHNGVVGHGVQLDDVPETRTAIITLRDPVQRFRSGYDMNVRDNEAGIRERYPTVNDMAMDIANIMYDMEWGYTYLPQSYWVRGSKYLIERNSVWMMTAQIDQFISEFKTKGMVKPKQHHNSQDIFGLKRSELTPIAKKAVMDAYAADYHMLSELGVPNSQLEQYNGVKPSE